MLVTDKYVYRNNETLIGECMATLDKFGVPSSAGSERGILQPKLQYKFRVSFDGFGDGSNSRQLTQSVVSVERPKINHASTAVHSYNSVAYAMGKHEWQTIEIVLRDDIQNSVVNVVGKQLQKQMNHFEQSSPVAGRNYKFTMRIESLDGNNNTAPLEYWDAEGCFLLDVNYGSRAYDSSELTLITLTVRADNYTHHAGGNEVALGSDPFTDDDAGLRGAPGARVN